MPLTAQSLPSVTLTEADAAEYLRVSIGYLRAARLTAPRTDGPPYVRLGRAVRYLRADLDAWLDSRRVDRHGRG